MSEEKVIDGKKSMEELEAVFSREKNKPDGGIIGISQKFANLNKLIIRDLNNPMSARGSFFSRYSKEQIAEYLANPGKNKKQLRDAVCYIYSSSPHFRRLIQYFVGLTDVSYIVEPYKIDPRTTNERMTGVNYRSVLNTLSSMNLRTQVPRILTVCLREDTFYGTIWETKDDIIIQQLPSDKCDITTVEGNVPNVTFDFSYFDQRKDLLEFYPKEFNLKYEMYKSGRAEKFIELDCPTSFAIKCNSDMLDYPIPPFAGILREIYDIEDYRDLKLSKTELDNYAMLAMCLPMDKDGNWGIDLGKAKEFWSNLDDVLPDEIGSVLTPMDIKKISFDRNGASDEDTITEAEQSLFTAAGVSSLLFNNEKASANAMLLSIKADQAITFGIVKSIEDALNRFIQDKKYGKNFRVNFLDVSAYNRKEAGDAYLKAASYGLPTISMYAASQGLGQAELDGMSFLETRVLGLQNMFQPIQSSTQMGRAKPKNLESKSPTDEGGAPVKEVGDISESGEQNQEDS